MAQDGAGNANTAATRVTVGYDNAVPGNIAPTADAGTDQTVPADGNRNGTGNAMVTLNGSLSSDDGSIISFAWTEGITTLATDIDPSVSVPLAAGVHILTLTVTDDTGLTGADTVIITVLKTFERKVNSRGSFYAVITCPADTVATTDIDLKINDRNNNTWMIRGRHLEPGQLVIITCIP